MTISERAGSAERPGPGDTVAAVLVPRPSARSSHDSAPNSPTPNPQPPIPGPQPPALAALARAAFDAAPTPALCRPSRGQAECLDRLREAVAGGAGLGVVLGAAGSG